jgi:tetratricopeptide (TPR) repeat protein
MAFEKARDLREELVQGNPRVPGFQRGLGEIYGNLGVYYAKAGDFDKSFQNYKKSSEIYEHLVRNHPNNSQYQADLAMSYRRLAIGHNRNPGAEEAKKAKEWLVKGRAILEQLLKNEPNVIRFQGELGLCCRDLGATCQKLSQPQEALQAYHQALGIFEKMVRTNPAVFGYRRELGKSYYNVGGVHGAARHTVEALLAYQQAREVLQKLVEDFPDNLDGHSDLGWTLHKLGLMLAGRGRPEEGIKALQEAVQHQRLAYERVPQQGRLRFDLQSHYGALAEVYRSAGRPADAVAATLERKKFWPDNPEELYKVAREICAAAELVGKGKVDLLPEEEAQRSHYVDHAMQALRQAAASGFKDLERLRKDRAFDALRQRAAFKAFLDELAKKSQAN